MTGICTLISQTYTKDAELNMIPTPIRKDVFCEEEEIYSSEFFEAKRSGLSASIMLKTATVNYSGEKFLEYKGNTYAIYRTYRKGDYIELYCEDKAGLKMKEETSNDNT